MKKSFILLVLVLLSVVSFSALSKEKTEFPEYTVEGLKRVPNPHSLAIVYAEPGANLSQYQRVYLTEPYVAFKKSWERDQYSATGRRVKTKDMDNIKGRVRELFLEVFTEELADGGYELADGVGEDVLVAKAAIIDLDVNAPDTMRAGRSATFVSHAGSMTLYLELYDSETGDLLAKALDPRSDYDRAYMQWQTGPANRAAGKRMMKPWAEALREGLDRAHKETGESQ
ncbi:MAG: DUF3313 domain-containing protein [Gammaproteobacteria bacterium]|nr:DUF3313 domain-containing protein [Gammaproteobacteria bacterium]